MSGKRERQLRKLYNEGDPTVEECECGTLFQNERRMGCGLFIIYNECLKCRNASDDQPYKYVNELGEEICLETAEMMLKKKKSANAKMKKDENYTNIRCKMIPIIEKSKGPSGKETMKETVSGISNVEKNGVRKIESEKTKTKGKDMQEIVPVKHGELMKDDEKEILPLDSIQLHNKLRVENVTSIQQLNTITRQLMLFAKSSGAPETIDDETGEVLKNAPAHKIQDAAKYLDMARNAIKTNLEVMKFGHELSKGNK